VSKSNSEIKPPDQPFGLAVATENAGPTETEAMIVDAGTTAAIKAQIYTTLWNTPALTANRTITLLKTAAFSNASTANKN